MSIKRVEIEGFLVFKGELVIDFSPGINVIIGDNGTGKTTLIKAIYSNKEVIQAHEKVCNPSGIQNYDVRTTDGKTFKIYVNYDVDDKTNYIYIPEKDILEHAKGLLPFIKQKQTSFTQVYEDILVVAQDVPTKEQSKTQKSIGQKIAEIIDGYVEWVPSDGMYYTIKTDGSRIPFIHEASGFKKLGLLGLLLSCGQLDSSTTLFWDEPENSLNPELVPKLVDILLELAQSGVQIFIASHNYALVRYFDVRRNKDVPVLFLNLTKDDGKIVCYSSPEYLKLPNNILEETGGNLFEAVIADAMEVQLSE